MSKTITVELTQAEVLALDTLCELELGAKEANRISAWRSVDTAQDKLLAAFDTLPIRVFPSDD